MRRAVILTTLTLLLLAVAGITMARESTVGPDWDSQTESTVQDLTTTTGEPTATITREPTDTTDEGSTEGSEPAARGVSKDSTEPEADEPEVTEEQATGGKGEDIGKPEGVGMGKGFGGKAEGRDEANDEEGEARGGEDQEKVTLCHKGKNTIMVGAPAEAAHVRHGDTLGPCDNDGTAREPPEEKLGPGVAQNGDGGSGNAQQKVTLCHKGKTLTVGKPAEAAHVRHGDTLGACG